MLTISAVSRVIWIKTWLVSDMIKLNTFGLAV